MLSIEYEDVIENVEIGDLFTQVGFPISVEPTDSEGDSFIKNEFAIEAYSCNDITKENDFYPIEGFRWTKPEETFYLKLESIDDAQEIKELVCSPDHDVMTQENWWTKVKNLRFGDLVQTASGKMKVTRAYPQNFRPERLCDLQVGITHSYYTNGILSHNSHFLISLGVEALKRKKNVVHYTFELSEAAIGLRYDSNLCDIDSSNVIDCKDEVLEKYKDMNLGKLIIKYFPTGTATVYTLRNHLERLSTKGFKPDVMIIDYADIMRSTRQFDSLRHELKLVYEELRAFAAELGVPLWSASQSNKEGATSDIIDLGNMSEAYGKAMVADVVLTISRKAHEKATGHARLYVAKNRAGKDGLVFPMLIDTSKSKFTITSGPGTFEEASRENEDEIKKALKVKWQELKSDPAIGDRMKKHEE